MEQRSSEPKPQFSIEHILRRAGQNQTRPQYPSQIPQTTPSPPPPDPPPKPPPHPPIFDWLRCTRYKPPKLRRSKRKEGVGKRKHGRNPRIPFTAAEVAALEQSFNRSPYLTTQNLTHLSTLLRLSETRVKIWFQNRRARERREKLVKGETMDLCNGTNQNDPRKHRRNHLTGLSLTWSAFIPCFQTQTSSSYC